MQQHDCRRVPRSRLPVENAQTVNLGMMIRGRRRGRWHCLNGRTLSGNEYGCRRREARRAHSCNLPHSSENREGLRRGKRGVGETRPPDSAALPQRWTPSEVIAPRLYDPTKTTPSTANTTLKRGPAPPVLIIKEARVGKLQSRHGPPNKSVERHDGIVCRVSTIPATGSRQHARPAY